jgi:hypothetical protein
MQLISTQHVVGIARIVEIRKRRRPATERRSRSSTLARDQRRRRGCDLLIGNCRESSHPLMNQDRGPIIVRA